jgi:hypothetical protein
MHPFLIAVAVALAQSESAKPQLETGADKAQFERWQKYYRRVAAECDIEQGKDLPTRLKLRPDPVLSYANPAGGGRSHGAMFVWTRDGRPEILGAIWSRQPGEQRYVIHEMHSLFLEPLTATRNGNLFWSPKVRTRKTAWVAWSDRSAHDRSKAKPDEVVQTRVARLSGRAASRATNAYAVRARPKSS